MSDVSAAPVEKHYTYVQDSEPEEPESGETWYHTDAGPEESEAKVWDGSSWEGMNITQHGSLSGISSSDHHSRPTETATGYAPVGYTGVDASSSGTLPEYETTTITLQIPDSYVFCDAVTARATNNTDTYVEDPEVRVYSDSDELVASWQMGTSGSWSTELELSPPDSVDRVEIDLYANSSGESYEVEAEVSAAPVAAHSHQIP